MRQFHLLICYQNQTVQLKSDIMKKLFPLFFLFVVIVLTHSCKKDNSNSGGKLEGTQSAMSVIGTTVASTSAPISGVSNLTASVVSLSNGISSYSGSGTVTNPTIKNILSNIPGITVSGDNVTATGFKYKQTTDGIECLVDIGPGVLVNYNSNVGDTYPVGNTGRTRTVVSKSTDNDYPYGYYYIKVLKVEEPTPDLKSTSMGITKVTYWANERFGLVAVQYDFSDGTSANFPVFSSVTNDVNE